MSDIRYHSSDDMSGLGEFEGVTEPVAVVLRPDGSVDVYGYIAVVDQRDGSPSGARRLAASWRGYIKTPDNDYSDGVADGLGQAASELEDLLNASEDQPQTVYVLTYSHKHGDDVSVYPAEAKALGALADIAREFWHEAIGYVGAEPEDNFPQSPDGLSDDQAIELYFAALEGRESWSIESAVL